MKIKSVKDYFNFVESEILRPSVLLILGTLFILAVSAHVLALKSITIILIFLVSFYLGEKLGFKIFKPSLKISKERVRTFSLVLFVVSLAALFYSFQTVGIPLLNSGVRRFLSPSLTYTSFLLVPATILLISALSKKRAKPLTLFLMFFSAGMMALLGYRTEVLAALIACTLTAYYVGIFKPKDIYILAILALVAFFGTTYIRAGALEFTSRITLSVATFDFLMENTGLLGLTHGYVQFADFFDILSRTPIYGGRVLVSTLVSGKTTVSMTSTLFGPVFVDFGILGIIIFAYFGVVLGAGYKAAKKGSLYAACHSILLTFILLGIETGIVDLIVWAYFIFISLFYLIAHNYI